MTNKNKEVKEEIPSVENNQAPPIIVIIQAKAGLPRSNADDFFWQNLFSFLKRDTLYRSFPLFLKHSQAGRVIQISKQGALRLVGKP